MGIFGDWKLWIWVCPTTKQRGEGGTAEVETIISNFGGVRIRLVRNGNHHFEFRGGAHSLGWLCGQANFRRWVFPTLSIGLLAGLKKRGSDYHMAGGCTRRRRCQMNLLPPAVINIFHQIFNDAESHSGLKDIMHQVQAWCFTGQRGHVRPWRGAILHSQRMSCVWAAIQEWCQEIGNDQRRVKICRGGSLFDHVGDIIGAKCSGFLVDFIKRMMNSCEENVSIAPLLPCPKNKFWFFMKWDVKQVWQVTCDKSWGVKPHDKWRKLVKIVWSRIFKVWQPEWSPARAKARECHAAQPLDDHQLTSCVRFGTLGTFAGATIWRDAWLWKV